MLLSPIRAVIWPFRGAKSNDGKSPVWRRRRGMQICNNTFVNVFITHSASAKEAKRHKRREWHTDTSTWGHTELTAATHTRRWNAWICPRARPSQAQVFVFCTTDFIYSSQAHIQLQLINVAFSSLKASTETLKSNLSDRWHFQSFYFFFPQKKKKEAWISIKH